MSARLLLPLAAVAALGLVPTGEPRAATPTATARAAAAGGLLAGVRPPLLSDAVSGEDLRALRSLRAASAVPRRAQAVDVGALQPYAFYPQAGLSGRDLFFYNFTDLDAGAGIRDWDCTGYTYDGHRGHDSSLRSFREQSIGVPIFAALDGTVLAAHDGEPDENTEWAGQRANFVVLDHGGGHRTWYFHMKVGSVAVEVGQEVKAGQQLGLTGSSGISNGPHLHFQSEVNNEWYEPSTGPCRPGPGQWLAQPPVARDLFVADFYLTEAAIPCCTWPDLAHDLDPALRRAAFRPGPRRINARLDLYNLPGGSFWRLRVRPPKGAPAVDVSGSFGVSELARVYIPIFFFNLPAGAPAGTWRMLLDVNSQTVLDAPFLLTQKPANRKPNPVRLSLSPAPPRADEVTLCRVETSLVHEDPDYDLVRYRYDWFAGKKLLRSVVSAALSDALPRGAAAPGTALSCRVTPSDGRANGKAATVRAVVKP